MGVIGFGLLFSGVVAFLAYRLVSRFIGRSRFRAFREIFAAAFGIVVFFATLVPATLWLKESLTETLIGMDPREGEKRLWLANLPEGTTQDLNYHQHYSADGLTVAADFQMSEDDFLRWTGQQDWDIKTLEPGQTKYALIVSGAGSDPFEEIEVENGYHLFFRETDDDAFFEVTYNSDTGRVHYFNNGPVTTPQPQDP